MYEQHEYVGRSRAGGDRVPFAIVSMDAVVERLTIEPKGVRLNARWELVKPLVV